MKLLVVVEKSRTGYSAYSPDLPGCVAAGKTRRRVERLMTEAARVHVEALRATGAKVPKSSTYVTYVEVAA